MNPLPQDTRRAPRRQVSDLVPVTDQMRDCVVAGLAMFPRPAC